MKAAVIDGYGGSERLEIREVPDPPPPGPGQLLLRVRAAAVNPIDWKIRRGRMRFLMPARFPLILGYDVAGEVVAVGPEVERFAPGDAAFGAVDVRRHGGSYAELALVREEALVRKPNALSWEEAAALPLAGLTALQALIFQGELAVGEAVLINGAAGGVGHLAVQIAFAQGASVTGVAGRTNQLFVRGLGAERTIDYEEEEFTALDERWDLIVDAQGNRTFRDCETVLSPAGGVYVTTHAGPDIVLWNLATAVAGVFNRDARRARGVRTRFNAEDLSGLSLLAERGRVHPEVAEILPLHLVAHAHDLSEAGHVRGKLVLRVE
jgi:NADPH:quinone reductase-like Zn-dependent oxidoreductase